MKRFSIFLLCVFVLVGCLPAKEETDPSDMSSDDNQYQYATTAYSWKLAESDHFYYHLAGNFLYSISKADGKARVVDNNPDTLDDAETDPVRLEESNAFFRNPRSVQYINGKLYVHAVAKNELAFDATDESVTYEDSIYEVDPAGGGQKEIFRAKEFLYDALIHRGYIYLSTSDAWDVDERIDAGELTEEDMANLTFQVERVPLEAPNQEPEIVYQNKGAKGIAMKMRAYGDYLYFVESPRRVNDFPYRQLICDLSTLEIKPLIHEQTNISDPVPVEDGLLFKVYQDSENPSQKEQELPDVYLIKTAYDGSKKDEFPLASSMLGYGHLYGYGELFCLDTLPYVMFGLEEERVLQLNNLDGETVAELKTPNQSGLILGMNSDYIFLEVQRSEVAEDPEMICYPEIYVVDLSQIGTSDLTFEPFFTYQPPTA